MSKKSIICLMAGVLLSLGGCAVVESDEPSGRTVTTTERTTVAPPAARTQTITTY